MLTGKKLFQAGDVSEMLASVLVKDPDVSSIGGHVPAHVRSVVRRCLVKDPKERIRDIGDVRQALKGDAEGSGLAASEATPAPLRFWQRPVPALMIAAGIAVAAGLAVEIASRSGSSPLPAPDLVRFTIAPPDTAPLGFAGLGTDLAISPDGRTIAYQGPNFGESSGTVALHIRSVDRLGTVPLRGGEDAIGPFFSPDGDWIGSVRNDDGRTLQRVSIFGGPPVTLGTAPSIIRGASWGTDDQIVFGTSVNGLMRIPGGGGEPEPLTVSDDSAATPGHWWPSIVSGRNAVLFVDSPTFSPLLDGQISVLDLETGQVSELGVAGTYPHYVSSGHLVYAAADNSVRAVTFDVDSLQVTGNPIPVVEGVAIKTGGAANFSISDAGRLVYALSSGAGDASVVWVDREGREEPFEGLDVGQYASLRLSPDGARLAFDLGNRRLWTYDIARGVRNPLTTGTGPGDRNPVWTPDGARIVFSRANGLFWMSADGTGEPEEVLVRPGASQLVPEGWTPEGDFLFSSVGGGRGPTAIETLSMDSERTIEVLIDTAQTEGSPVVSPDGQWMAYHSDVAGRHDVYVQQFPGLGDRQQVSPDGGRAPLWSPDGDELFYRSIDGRRGRVHGWHARVALRGAVYAVGGRYPTLRHFS